MAKLETALSLEQILEGMRQLSDQEKRALASIILSDPSFEAFVEEVDDSLTCERAVNEGRLWGNPQARVKILSRNG